MNIKPILDLAIDYNPNLCMADISTPYSWLNSGCDMELDILPALQESMKRPRKDKIRTFSYWTIAIMASRDKRLLAATIKEQKEKPIDPEIKAKRLLWKIEMGYILSQEDENFLNSYCQKSNLSI